MRAALLVTRMPDHEREQPKPAPLEITIRFDPTSAKRAAHATKNRAQSAGAAVSTWFSAHTGGIAIAGLVAGLAVFVWLIGGAAHALAVAVAGAITYGAIRLKARHSPLIRD